MSENQRRTILYGDSLILQGVRADLAGHPGLEVLMLDQPLEEPLEELRALSPAVIIFDLGAVQPDFLLALLQKPDLVLIGVDPETHQALVLSGQPARALTTDDLLHVIEALPRAPGARRE